MEEKGNPHRSSVTRLPHLHWYLVMGAQLRPFTRAPVPGACFQQCWGAPISCRGHRPPHPMPSQLGEQEGEGGGTAPAPSAAGREPPFHAPAFVLHQHQPGLSEKQEFHSDKKKKKRHLEIGFHHRSKAKAGCW